MSAISVQIRNTRPDLDIAFEARPGLTALFGRSGAGKTSVLRAVAGLLRADSVRIVVNGRTLSGVAVHKRRVGYVFQEPRLLPHRSVRGNLLYGARTSDGLDEIAGLLGIEPLLERRPASLSGGEAQRVAIGRALLCEPSILLMDEPLASLDAARRDEILPYIERLRDLERLPILYVSHDPGEVARLADTLVLIEGGRVAASGPLAEVLADAETAAIFGPGAASSVLTLTVAAHAADGLSRLDGPGGPLHLPGVTAPVGARVRVRLRADDVILSPDRPHGLSALNVIGCRITRIRTGSGPGALVQLSADGAPLIARVTRRSVAALGLAEGQQVHAILKAVAVARTDIGGG